MAYQNNNSRITPQATQGLIKITPTAEITDQLIKPQILIGEQKEIENRQALADSLVNIGKGINLANEVLKTKAEDAAANLIAQDNIEGNNKHEWKEAQKQIPILKIINPYIQNSYKKLAANEIGTAYYNKLQATPNLDKMTSEEFAKVTNNSYKEYVNALKEAGINTSQAKDSLINYQKNTNNLIGKQLIASNQLKYEITLSKHNESLVHQSLELHYNIKDQKERKQALSDLVNGYVVQAQELGIPDVDIITNLKSNLENIMQEAASDEDVNFSLADIKEIYKNININGLNLDTISPDWSYKISKKYKDIQLEITQEENRKRVEKLHKQQDDTNNSISEMLKFMVENPKATPDELIKKRNELIEKYGDYVISDLTNTMRAYQTNTENLETKNLDAVEFGSLLIDIDEGKISMTQIRDILTNCSQTQGTQLIHAKQQYENKQMQKRQMALHEQEVAEQKALRAKVQQDEQTLKSADKMLSDLYKEIKPKSEREDTEFVQMLKSVNLYSEYLQDLNKLKIKIDSHQISGESALKQSLVLKQDYIDTINRMKNAQIQYTKGFNKNQRSYLPIETMNIESRKSMNNPIRMDYDIKKASKAISSMGILPEEEKVEVTQMYGTEGDSSYKLKARENLALPVPDISGGYVSIVSSGYNDIDGNFSLVTLGKYGERGTLKYSHLSKTLPSGTEIAKGGIIGYASSDLKVQFWNNKNNRTMMADEFLKYAPNQKQEKTDSYKQAELMKKDPNSQYRGLET